MRKRMEWVEIKEKKYRVERKREGSEEAKPKIILKKQRQQKQTTNNLKNGREKEN